MTSDNSPKQSWSGMGSAWTDWSISMKELLTQGKMLIGWRGHWKIAQCISTDIHSRRSWEKVNFAIFPGQLFMQGELGASSSCLPIIVGAAGFLILTRFCTAYLNFSSWNNYCSLLSAIAENLILLGKISFISISVNIPSIQPFIVLSRHDAWRKDGSEEQSSCEQVMGRRPLQEINVLLWNGLYFVAAVLLLVWFFQEYSSSKTLQALGSGWAASVAWLAGALEESCRVRPGTTRPVLMWYDTNSLHRPKPVWLWHPAPAGRQQKACEEAWEKKGISAACPAEKSIDVPLREFLRAY